MTILDSFPAAIVISKTQRQCKDKGGSKDKNDIKEEAANNVRASVESFPRELFDCLGGILDAREAAVVVVAVAMERAGVPNEGQGKLFCISVNSRRVSPRAVGREGSFDSVMLRGAPGKRTRRAANFAGKA